MMANPGTLVLTAWLLPESPLLIHLFNLRMESRLTNSIIRTNALWHDAIQFRPDNDRPALDPVDYMRVFFCCRTQLFE